MVAGTSGQGQVKDIGAPPARDDKKAMLPSTMKPAAPAANVEQAVKEAIEDSGSSSGLSGVGLSFDTRNGEKGADSAIGDASLYTTSTSVRSSVYQFIEENGRTYHRYREGKYFLPNDEKEQDRLDLQHHLFLLTLSGELFNAPIKDLEGGLNNVLDIGTGTGMWAIEFANKFPDTNVIGTDLSPIQPDFTPSNCSFTIDDAEDTPWAFSTPFDYIHGRALATCFRSHLPVIQSAFNALRPGGWLELQDCIVPFQCIDNTLSGTSLEKWANLIMEGTKKLGKDWTRVREYKRYLQEAGFVDVIERKYEWPVGTWAKGKRNKMLGAWYREDLLVGLAGFTNAVLTRGCGMTISDIEELLVGVRRDIESNAIHIYIPVRVVYGRKPS